jgi:hypothetical protein
VTVSGAARYLLSVAVQDVDVPAWELLLVPCPAVRFDGVAPVTTLCRWGSWVSCVPRRLQAAGLSVPQAGGDGADAPVPQLVTVTGPRPELKHALAEASTIGLPVAVVEFHRTAYRAARSAPVQIG